MPKTSTANNPPLSHRSSIHTLQEILLFNSILPFRNVMFRATKKKKPIIKGIEVSHDDDEDSPPTVVVKSKTTKKRPRPSVIRSFQEDDDDDDDDDIGDLKPRRDRGLGFGGGGMMPFVEHQVDLDKEQQQQSVYDKATLEALKGSQTYQKIEKLPLMEPPIITNKEEESFIPLHDSYEEPISILTGDEVDAFLSGELEQQQKGGEALLGVKSKLSDKLVKPEATYTSIVDDDSSDWEVQVTKRAGISTASKRTTKSLEDLRNHLSQAMTQLQTQDEDLKHAYNRRQVELTFAEEQAQKYQSALHEAGEALEYYQEVRLLLTNFAGALRDLQKRLQPLQEALRKTAVGGDRWTDWERDALVVLRNADLLIQVVGRQPPLELEAETVVDEFGRNVKTQDVMARERRYQQRLKIREIHRIDGYDSDALQTPAEVEELQQRREALNQALKIALNELDDAYSSFPALMSIFEEWHKKYPQDYIGCHAGMSLADLASVLLQVDLCSTHHPLHWSLSNRSFPFMARLQTMSIEENVEETPLYRVVDKVLIPCIEDVLEQKAYNVHSSKQSKSMATYFKEVTKLQAKGNILVDKLTHEMVGYLRMALSDMAVPIVKNITSNDDIVVEAVKFATMTQLERIQKILSNIFHYWVPLIGDRLADSLLDFCANQFLILVSSLESPKVEFSKVWRKLSHWLDRPEYLVEASQLRAAAAAYDLDLN
jgi:hypothetical protein